MERIKSINEYKELLRRIKNRLGQIATNCFLMPASIDRFINQDRIFAEESENGLFVLVDEGRYYNLYYYRKEESQFLQHHLNKPVVIEELNNNGTRDSYLLRLEPTLLQAGFELYKNNLQLELSLIGKSDELNKQFENRISHISAQGFTLDYCSNLNSFSQAHSLWTSSLDLADVPQDHFALNRNDRLAGIFSSEGTVLATHWWRTSGKSSEGRHTVTHSDFYQRGFASVLLLAWLIDAQKQGINRCLTWISDTNYRSLALYGKHGFSINGRTCRQYILR